MLILKILVPIFFPWKYSKKLHQKHISSFTTSILVTFIDMLLWLSNVLNWKLAQIALHGLWYFSRNKTKMGLSVIHMWLLFAVLFSMTINIFYSLLDLLLMTMQVLFFALYLTSLLWLFVGVRAVVSVRFAIFFSFLFN